MSLEAADGSYAAVGSSFPSIPGIVIGHNGDIGWAVTTVGADVQDVYAMTDDDSQRFPDGRPARFMYKGQSLPYQLRRETSVVKGAEAIEMDVRESVYGPVISDHVTGMLENWVGGGPDIERLGDVMTLAL